MEDRTDRAQMDCRGGPLRHAGVDLADPYAIGRVGGDLSGGGPGHWAVWLVAGRCRTDYVAQRLVVDRQAHFVPPFGLVALVGVGAVTTNVAPIKAAVAAMVLVVRFIRCSSLVLTGAVSRRLADSTRPVANSAVERLSTDGRLT